MKGAVKIQRLTEKASAQNRPTGNEHIPEIEEPSTSSRETENNFQALVIDEETDKQNVSFSASAKKIQKNLDSLNESIIKSGFC